MTTRREFIMLVGGAVAWPVVAWAQQTKMPVIGFLSTAIPGPQLIKELAAFHQGLNGAGYVEGRNLTIEYRWASGRNDQLQVLAAELARLQVAVIVTTGGDGAAFAAKSATATIPIVFVTSTDPVKTGLVTSLNRPSGNITGVSRLSIELLPKRLELLLEVVPNAAEIAILVNPANLNAEPFTKVAEAAVRSLGRQVRVLRASTESEIDAVFATLVQLRLGALLIVNDPFFSSQREKLGALTLRNAVPAIYEPREFVAAGGLMSYGASIAEAYRLIGIYTGRVLRGERPADLPVQQQTKVEFVINLKTARSLGATIPLPLLARADEVIE